MNKWCMFCDNEATVYFDAEGGHYDLCYACSEVWWSGYRNAESYFSVPKITARQIFEDRVSCVRAVFRIIDASQWFLVLPLPDYKWEIRVKIENSELLKGL